MIPVRIEYLDYGEFTQRQSRMHQVPNIGQKIQIKKRIFKVLDVIWNIDTLITIIKVEEID